MTALGCADFYDDLSATLAKLQRVLTCGVSDRHAAAHHPVVATIDSRGVPVQRVMILRECDWLLSTLRFHTDMRSQKVAELDDSGAASILIYDEAAKFQIRMTGIARTGTQTQAELAWNASTEFARRCYMIESAPGTVTDRPQSGLPVWIEGKKPAQEQLHDARKNFAILYFVFHEIDWLFLANSGHRRAKFRREAGQSKWSGHWVIP